MSTYIILIAFECDTRIYRTSRENTAFMSSLEEGAIFKVSAVYS